MAHALATMKGMAVWQPFTSQGITYDLAHLDPFDHVYVQAAVADKSERQFRVRIQFGHHCFTEGRKPGDDPSLVYSAPAKDLRTFDVTRWQLSHLLPGIVRELMTRPISHTGHDNFFTIEVATVGGGAVEYEVYFHVELDFGRHLHLVVTSAFPRDPSRVQHRADRRPMRLALILHNVQVGKPIKAPPRAGRRRWSL